MTSLEFTPMFANALTFAFEKATIEGKMTMAILAVLSLFSWTVIITKARQLYVANKSTKKFFTAFRATRDPLDLLRSNQEFDGAPAYEVYRAGVDELAYHLKNNPVHVKSNHAVKAAASLDLPHGNTDQFSRAIETKVSHAAYDSVRVSLERAVSTEGMALEKGMIILTTAVAGGPFIGLLGTVWGVMETFSGIAIAKSASLTVMAPGVAGALIATVIGLFVAIPAMFAFNFMVTNIRRITQEIDGYVGRYAAQVEQEYVDTRGVADEIKEANAEFADKIVAAIRSAEPNQRPMTVLANLD